MRLPGVTQVQVNPRAGLTFPRRAARVHAPGPQRGHGRRDARRARRPPLRSRRRWPARSVFTTLHANDAPRTIERLVELGAARHSLAGALTAIVAQRLVRTLCERCRARETVPAACARRWARRPTSWYAARGCRACVGTGYLGRTGIYELIDVDDATRDAIAGGALERADRAGCAARGGYRAMIADALREGPRRASRRFDELARRRGLERARERSARCASRPRARRPRARRDRICISAAATGRRCASTAGCVALETPAIDDAAVRGFPRDGALGRAAGAPGRARNGRR